MLHFSILLYLISLSARKLKSFCLVVISVFSSGKNVDNIDPTSKSGKIRERGHCWNNNKSGTTTRIVTVRNERGGGRHSISNLELHATKTVKYDHGARRFALTFALQALHRERPPHYLDSQHTQTFLNFSINHRNEGVKLLETKNSRVKFKVGDRRALQRAKVLAYF